MLIGLDKQIIKPTIIGMNYDKLRGCDNVIIDTDGETYPVYDYIKKRTVPISYISITDNTMFNVLKIGTYRVDMGVGIFCYLDISKMGADDCNLIPYTVEGFRVYADKCVQYIKDRYGINLNVNHYKGEKMEMNVTITLEDKFNEYVMTSLRTSWGCNVEKIERDYGKSYAHNFLKNIKKYEEKIQKIILIKFNFIFLNI